MTFIRTNLAQLKSTDAAEAIEQAHRAAFSIRRQYGLDRLQLGFILHTIHEQKLWVGKAESFSGYLQDLRINSSAARQYMAAAKTFIVDFDFPDAIIEALAMCNMAVLYEATKIITPENAEEVLSSLLVLHQRDALQGLKEMAPDYDFTRDPPAVNRMVDQFYALTDDLRLGFLARIHRKSGQQVAVTS